MSVLVGSARIDENGNIRNGKAGDQTAREVCTEPWYTHSKGWVTLRAKDTAVADKIATAMERACANDKIGYDQYQRNTLYDNIKYKKFDPAKATACETDCSALVRVCLAYAGIIVPDFNTTTEKKVILNTGKFYEVPTSESTAKRGDILVTKTQGHTVIVLSDGKNEQEKSKKFYPDISDYHHVTNWSKVKAQCPFMISRATQGVGTKTTPQLLKGVDRYLDEFIKGCEKYKIPYWLFCYLDNGDEKKQAEFMVKTCKNKVGKYFVGYVLDVEEENSADGVKAAMDYLVKQSSKIMVYTGYRHYSLYKDILKNLPENIGWWESRYGKNDGYYSDKFPCHKNVDLMQYTSEGAVSGISGRVDLNRLTGKKPESWFTDGKASSVPVKDELVFTYAVRAGGVILEPVENLSDYAGVRGNKITDIAIKVNKGKVRYRVHVKEQRRGGTIIVKARWLSWVTGYDWNDDDNGYAGIGKAIDAVQVELSGVAGQKAQYRVSPVNKSYYDWQYNTETTNGQDGYAGDKGVAIDRFQIC